MCNDYVELLFKHATRKGKKSSSDPNNKKGRSLPTANKQKGGILKTPKASAENQDNLVLNRLESFITKPVDSSAKIRLDSNEQNDDVEWMESLLAKYSTEFENPVTILGNIDQNIPDRLRESEPLEPIKKDLDPPIWLRPLDENRNVKKQYISNLSSNQKTLSNGMEFMRIPSSIFEMGNDNYLDGEKPLHSTDIPYDYWMAHFPVTNEFYNNYVKAEGIKHPVDGWEKKKKHPVVLVNWHNATAYCQWLMNQIKSELPSGFVLRLPTEAEWEKAARSTDGRTYPWGNTFDENKCNSAEGGKDGTTSVGLYSPHGDSPYNCSDMAGNVWEWTHSLDKQYPYNALDGRENEQENVTRVLRGGSFNNTGGYLRCSFRYRYYSDLGFKYFGFRLTLAPPLPK